VDSVGKTQVRGDTSKVSRPAAARLSVCLPAGKMRWAITWKVVPAHSGEDRFSTIPWKAEHVLGPGMSAEPSVQVGKPIPEILSDHSSPLLVTLVIGFFLVGAAAADENSRWAVEVKKKRQMAGRIPSATPQQALAPQPLIPWLIRDRSHGPADVHGSPGHFPWPTFRCRTLAGKLIRHHR